MIGQAPGVRVHAVGAPFVDPSGERLRDWMGVDETVFYDPEKVAVAPAGFCFPGLTPGGADRPPRRECAPQWQHRVRDALPGIGLTLLVGGYGHKIGLGERAVGGVTETVRRFAEFAPRVIPLPHPSWRNSAWLKKHTWFETDLLPVLRAAVAGALR